MSDTPQPTNRKLRRAADTDQNAHVYRAANSQGQAPRKATHITRSFTPPEPPADAGKPASTAAHFQNGDLRSTEPSQKPDAPLADEKSATGEHKANAPAKAKPAKADKQKRGRKGKAKANDAPPTPADIIKARRRRCADAEDIASFFTKLIAIVVLLVLLFGFAFGVTPMANDDMSPRISAGDLLLYYRLSDDLVTGDVLVFEKDGEQYVGRIVANPGDTVEVTDQATLMVNGSTVLESDIYYTTPKYDDGPAYPITLAQDEYFILCDYREGARDSRYFGPVSASEIKGKVITVIRRSGL